MGQLVLRVVYNFMVICKEAVKKSIGGSSEAKETSRHILIEQFNMHLSIT